MGSKQALCTQFPHLHFEFISDGLPDDPPRSLIYDFFWDIKKKTKPHFKEPLLFLNAQSSPPVTCIIYDQYAYYPLEVAEELKIPVFTFCAHSACSTLTYFIVPKLIEEGQLPFADVQDPAFQFLHKETTGMHRYSSGLIINTFDLEIGKHGSKLMASHASFRKADRNCIAWLDSHPLRSVLYVSFGSLIQMTISQTLEFWHGLVNSGHPFLWVVRQDAVISKMEQQQPPHVVLHSIPAHGHIRPLLFLAQLLSQAGFYITFVFTHHFRKSFENLTALSTQFPNLHFEFISDGLPDDHPRSLTFDFFFDIKTKTKPHLKELILLLNAKLPPVTCIISDQYILYPVEVAEELGIPSFTFSSHSASCTLTYFIVPKLIEDGHLPFADDDMNHEINSVPGLEGILRRRNLPAFCVLKDVHHPAFQFLLNEFTGMTRYSSGLIINTFDELEDQCLPQLATHFGKVYSVGPLHATLNSKIGKYGSQLMGSHISSWKADQNCLAWLDSQPLKSVLYVSFGSLINVSVSQLLEFWHGLVNSGHPFLWVIRPDVILSG
ncbi:hypothetical protein FEM48_Zijuj11G0159900 [Ziziphus jujuba var. spinosa]|uniref:Uncharacterized protein n=1 Tax=Ziziphus jujuba var. spinosa TaxID=714518 RepID=A0A978UJW5_ZIZJJ|nr:hypothetical protein FEM48_Zijuj11G0159900 [Ziziphus jujuba var. spinosa]